MNYVWEVLGIQVEVIYNCEGQYLARCIRVVYIQISIYVLGLLKKGILAQYQRVLSIDSCFSESPWDEQVFCSIGRSK